MEIKNYSFTEEKFCKTIQSYVNQAYETTIKQLVEDGNLDKETAESYLTKQFVVYNVYSLSERILNFLKIGRKKGSLMVGMDLIDFKEQKSKKVEDS